MVLLQGRESSSSRRRRSGDVEEVRRGRQQANGRREKYGHPRPSKYWRRKIFRSILLTEAKIRTYQLTVFDISSQETEELKHETVNRSLSLVLQKARNDKGMTQKDLATKVIHRA